MAQDKRPRNQHNPRYRFVIARLREAREAVGMTQTDVAKRLGRTQAYVSKTELSERRMDVVELLDFAAIYGLDLDFFLPPAKKR